MSTTGVSVFDETLQVTRGWLNDVMARLDSADPHHAYLALRVCLHALRDRLPPENAVHLAAQLPMLVRGFYFEGWKPSVTPTPERSQDEFLAHIQQGFGRAPAIDAEEAARAVFLVLADRLSQGEVRKVIQVLPHDIRALWPRNALEGEA